LSQASSSGVSSTVADSILEESSAQDDKGGVISGQLAIKRKGSENWKRTFGVRRSVGTRHRPET